MGCPRPRVSESAGSTVRGGTVPETAAPVWLATCSRDRDPADGPWPGLAHNVDSTTSSEPGSGRGKKGRDGEPKERGQKPPPGPSRLAVGAADEEKQRPPARLAVYSLQPVWPRNLLEVEYSQPHFFFTCPGWLVYHPPTRARPRALLALTVQLHRQATVSIRTRCRLVLWLLSDSLRNRASARPRRARRRLALVRLPRPGHDEDEGRGCDT